MNIPITNLVPYPAEQLAALIPTLGFVNFTFSSCANTDSQTLNIVSVSRDLNDSEWAQLNAAMQASLFTKGPAI